MPTAAVQLETRNIQGIVLTGYSHLPHSCYLFLHINDRSRAKAWLAAILRNVTTSNWDRGDGKIERPEWALNIAFTPRGLEQFGVTPDAKSGFAQEFIEGMAEEFVAGVGGRARPRRLGDIGASAPALWEVGGVPKQEDKVIHVLLIIQAMTKSNLESLCEKQRARFEGNIAEVAEAEFGYLPIDHKEHFGFADSVSQPEVEGSPKKKKPNQSLIKAGEFILGYENEYNVMPTSPRISAALDPLENLKLIPHSNEKDFGKNGSYLVFRKLHQDVAGFRRYLRDFVDDEKREIVAAKMVGRWPSGAPLMLAPEQDDQRLGSDEDRNNEFLFMKLDAEGLRCPIGAHIRRTNPRDSLPPDTIQSIISVNRHRLLRRGALYGSRLPPDTFEDDNQPRGLLFFCINADIERQFEFVQHTWANNPKIGGAYSDRDPLIGSNRESSSEPDDGPWNFTIPERPVRHRLTDLPRFVIVKGGGYYFLPSLPSLHVLAGFKDSLSKHSNRLVDS